jgi:hypothetical protein
MKVCAICFKPAGEGKRTFWTRNAGYITICWDCWIDLSFELGIEEEDE